MNQSSLSNLKKWPKGTSGNPDGRKLGSKNISTIVRELLEQDIDTSLPLNAELKQIINGKNTSYAKGIVYSMLIKALKGDVKASVYLTDLLNQAKTNELDTGLFNTSKLQIEIVKSNKSTLN